MDCYELISTVRDYSGLEDENEIGTPLLLRHVNLANQRITNLLYKVFDQYLIKTVVKEAQSGIEVTAPGDVLNILNVWREKTAAADDYQLCTRVPVDRQGLIGRVNWPANDDKNPLYVNEGRNLKIYPTMTTLDVKIQYRKRVVDMAFGSCTADGTTSIVLDAYAKKEDDSYNDYFVSLYSKINGTMVFDNLYKITDYAGSTRTATIDSATALDSASDEVYYAMVPLLPEEFHPLIVDASLVELGKNQRFQQEGRFSMDFMGLQNQINAQIRDILQVNDVQETQMTDSGLNIG